MKKLLTVLGARPQFIKAATVSRAISEREWLSEVLVHTGQHFDANMSDVFFEELAIPAPDYHLGVAGGGHGAMTGRMLERLEEVLEKEAPDWVLVYGDTNSTLAGALAAAKLHIPVAHVEAGLRSFNRRMPEEVNRVLTDHASDLLFTPTDTATANLGAEGVDARCIHQVGDVMFDAALFYGQRAEERSRVLTDHGLERGGYVLATVHRQENTDDPERLRAIFEAFQTVARERPVVLPLHPRTRARLEEAGLLHLTQGLTILPPVGYLDMVMLERTAAVIATDSGGVQKEAYFHGVPCVTLREETEWTELVELGWNRLVVPGLRNIAEVFSAAMDVNGRAGSPYGEGDAAVRIVGRLC
jgi:UDP-GlcNAc3NAcA epimerase